MTKKPEIPPEVHALHSAFIESGMTKAAVADHMDVTPAAVRQWIAGDRPVPATKAGKLAALLSVEPDRICAAYAEISKTRGNVVPIREDDGSDQRRPDLAIRRLENDVDALRYAIAGIVSVSVIHRPAEALSAAAAIRKSVPKKYLERGFVYELLLTLDAAARA